MKGCYADRPARPVCVAPLEDDWFLNEFLWVIWLDEALEFERDQDGLCGYLGTIEQTQIVSCYFWYLKHDCAVAGTLWRYSAIEVVGTAGLVREDVTFYPHQLEKGWAVHDRFLADILHGQYKRDQA